MDQPSAIARPAAKPVLLSNLILSAADIDPAELCVAAFIAIV